MKNILLIGTGGTIASERGDEGLFPAADSARMLECVPEVKDICRVTATELYRLDSTNMRPEHWLNIAQYIKREYDRYDGFVITHGTDTMAYAAALTYYLVQNSPKPIVFTGAQIPIFARDTDARENLADAFRYAAFDGASGVKLVFGGRIIAATRARKVRTKSFNAFSSIDYPDVGFVRDGRVVLYINGREEGPVRFYDRIDSSVMVIKLTPGMSAGIFDYAAEHCHAVIVESFGVGGIPYYDNDEFADKIGLLVSRGVRIIVSTQVPHEGSDMSVYSVGVRIKERYELPEAYDMTTEAVLAKVMWALAQTKSAAEFNRLFLAPVGADRI